MLQRHLARFAPFVMLLALYGCASDDNVMAALDDGPTPEEAAAGEEWTSGPDGDAVSEEGLAHGAEANTDEVNNDALSTELEDSAPFLDVEDTSLIGPDGLPLPDLDNAEVQATQKCQKATGYRKGKAFTICVTTINGKLVEVNTARAYLRMRKAATARGVSLYVVSGFRTMAKQRYLYNCYRTKRCNGGNLAAPPGYSNHQSGRALDLNTSARGVYSFLSSRGSTYRFKRTVPSERWHWEHY